jgi:hypothetical protein
VNRKWFGEKVCEVVGAFTPSDDVLTLSYTIANPVISHVYTFGPFGFDGV